MSDLPQRRLGADGPLVSAIGFGAAVLSPGYYEAVVDDESIAAIHHALDRGINLLDTSDVYGVGHNETLVGKAIADRRDQVVLSSKFGWVIDGSSGTVVETGYKLPGFRSNGRPDYVRERIEGSLRRLGTDYLDLYYQHFPDPDTPVEETVGAMAQLVQEGKVRFLGLCNVDAERLRRACTEHPISAVENEYSLWARTPEASVLPTARELGVGFVPWAPLGSGFLAGALDEAPSADFRVCQPRFESENFARNRERYAVLGDIAAKRDITRAQLSLAWLLHRGEQVVPIPGMTKPWQVDENIAAARITLDADTMKQIDRLLPADLAAGAELI